MSTTVSMPQLGETVTEGTILSWSKGVGESISQDEVLVEVSTDKVDTEVPSPVAGVILEILVPEGETVPVGTALVVIGEAGEAVASPSGDEPATASEESSTVDLVGTAERVVAKPDAIFEVVNEPTEEAPAIAASVSDKAAGIGSGTLGFLSPVVKKLAREFDIDVADVPGTGRGGRVTRQDILAYVERRDQSAADAAPGDDAPDTVELDATEVPDVPDVPEIEVPDVPDGSDIGDVPDVGDAAAAAAGFEPPTVEDLVPDFTADAGESTATEDPGDGELSAGPSEDAPSEDPGDGEPSAGPSEDAPSDEVAVAAADVGEVTTVAMPQLGETVTEGTILSWVKSVGESVSADDVLVEISTDKVDTEVPSPVSGVVLEILVPEGETVAVGTDLVRIGAPGAVPVVGGEPAPASEPAVPAAETAEPAPTADVEDEPVHVSLTPEPEESAEDVAAAAVAAAGVAAGAAGVGAAAAADVGEVTTVAMPQLGETVTEGTILSWVKSVGESVSADDVLVEISTDKVDTEVPSPVSGVVLEILVPEGETVAVGTDLVRIGAPGAVLVVGGEPAPAPEPAADPAPVAAVAEVAEAAIEPEPVVAARVATTDPSDMPESLRFVSPVVRKLAREHDVDIADVAGTGRNGRVTRNDILNHIEAQGVAPAAPTAPVPPAPAAPVAPAPAPAAPAVPVPAAPAPDPAAAAAPAADDAESVYGTKDLSRLRARIGENMIAAKQTAAHVWTSVEVDFEAVERVRQRHKASFKADEGFSLTYLPFIARAVVDALRAFPVVNSSFYLEEKRAVFHEAINLGVAVDLNQDGLLVATVKDADERRMRSIARSVRELATRARDNKLEPDDISASTFTITNPGPFGSFMSAPIINVPNVAILSTDTVTKRPTVITTPDGQDTIAIRHIGYLGLSWDHRAFDGSTAVLFLRRLKENLETWDWEQELR